MTILSITEAARAVGVARSTIYKRIQDGALSVTIRPDGSKGVDSEQLRQVFGQLPVENEQKPSTTKTANQSAASQKQVEQLQQQLKACQEREQRLLAKLNQCWLLPGVVLDSIESTMDTINRILGKKS